MKSFSLSAELNLKCDECLLNSLALQFHFLTVGSSCFEKAELWGFVWYVSGEVYRHVTDKKLQLNCLLNSRPEWGRQQESL